MFRSLNRFVRDLTRGHDDPTALAAAVGVLEPVTAADFDWPVDYADELPADLALAAVIDAMEGVTDFLWLCGEDV